MGEKFLDWFMDNVGPWFILILMFSIPVLLVFAAFHGSSLYNECLADGHKAYECHAMLNNNVVVYR